MIPHVITELVDTFTHVTCLEFEHKGEFMIANIDATLKIVDNRFVLEKLNSWSLCECVHPFLLYVIDALSEQSRGQLSLELSASVEAALLESITKLPEQNTNENINFIDNAT
jgi:hypothetical protein